MRGFAIITVFALLSLAATPRPSQARDAALAEGHAAGVPEFAAPGPHEVAVLRKAVDLYQAEHDGAYPAAATIADQLTKRTNAAGTVQPTPGTDDNLYPFGPYLRAIPPLSVGANKGQTAFHAGAVGAANYGWHYTASTGVVKANTADGELDATGKKYNEY